MRLDTQVRARLDAVAKRIGTTRAGIARFCIDTWLSHYERVEIAALPPDWERIIASFDGRRSYPPNSTHAEVSSGSAGEDQSTLIEEADIAEEVDHQLKQKTAIDAPIAQKPPPSAVSYQHSKKRPSGVKGDQNGPKNGS